MHALVIMVMMMNFDIIRLANNRGVDCINRCTTHAHCLIVRRWRHDVTGHQVGRSRMTIHPS